MFLSSYCCYTYTCIQSGDCYASLQVVSEVATGTSEEIKWALQFGYVAYFEVRT